MEPSWFSLGCRNLSWLEEREENIFIEMKLCADPQKAELWKKFQQCEQWYCKGVWLEDCAIWETLMKKPQGLW